MKITIEEISQITSVIEPKFNLIILWSCTILSIFCFIKLFCKNKKEIIFLLCPTFYSLNYKKLVITFNIIFLTILSLKLFTIRQDNYIITSLFFLLSIIFFQWFLFIFIYLLDKLFFLFSIIFEKKFVALICIASILGMSSQTKYDKYSNFLIPMILCILCSVLLNYITKQMINLTTNSNEMLNVVKRYYSHSETKKHPLKIMKLELLFSEFVIFIFASSCLIYTLSNMQINNTFPFSYNKEFDNIFDTIYYCITSFSTVGYGDIYPTNWGSKVISVFIICIGMFFSLCLVASILDKGNEEMEEYRKTVINIK